MTWRELDALSVVWRRKERRKHEHTALLRWTMASCFATNPPAFESFMPPDPDADEQRATPTELKVDNVMRSVGGKAALNPESTPVVRTEEDEAFMRRINAKLQGKEK